MVDLRTRNAPFALATVIEIEGSVSAKTGAKALIGGDGRVLAGWVGGGCAESTVCHTALDCLRVGEGRVITLDMNDEVLGTGMPCGGSMRVYVEPVLPRPTLWILGHGRVAECLCAIGAMMDLEIVVDDPLVDRAHYPAAARLLTEDMDYGELEPGADDYVVIATQHKGDHQSMQRALRSAVRYVALIASRKRSRLVLDYLRAEGFGEDDMARVHAPAGLDLAPRTPEEIALAVLSEIVMLRRGGNGTPARDRLRAEPARRPAGAPAPVPQATLM
ncbi:MAG: XdhC family protein [Solirubrobacteraceae bacterium]